MIVLYFDKGLDFQANMLIYMLSANTVVQLITILGQCWKKSMKEKILQSAITIFQLRPFVDCYRVSTGKADAEHTVDSLTLMFVNKGIEMGTEGIPGCVFQFYVLLQNPVLWNDGGAIASILVSCLSTGFFSAMIAFDMDCDPPHRLVQPKFYGYIKDGYNERGRTFFIMMLMSTLHNLSRSAGYAILAVEDKMLAVKFFGAEMGVYLAYKLVRRDFWWWGNIEGVVSVVLSFLERSIVKIIADFTGCIHFRHPYELGGTGYSLSMIWAQVFPFVALQFSTSEKKELLASMLQVSFGAWLTLNTLFFAGINREFIRTFFTKTTGPEYTVLLFREAPSDELRFDAAFTNRRSYINGLEDEVRAWLRDNIGRFQLEQPEWWRIDMVGDEFLPEAEGGARRRRSSVQSVREILGIKE
jgi:hypothetical protein